MRCGGGIELFTPNSYFLSTIVEHLTSSFLFLNNIGPTWCIKGSSHFRRAKKGYFANFSSCLYYIWGFPSQLKCLTLPSLIFVCISFKKHWNFFRFFWQPKIFENVFEYLKFILNVKSKIKIQNFWPIWKNGLGRFFRRYKVSKI